MINYMDLVRDALDYRKWFEFQMFYRKTEESRKNLTNAAFNRFSGGEKAMAMYVRCLRSKCPVSEGRV
ncbi:SbcC/MukB-like Walker B domain-containing protein [Eubacterium ramulus]|uniref:SbcC/MukB-like Walker B domain-containing protein n=1 Tax=Eubacterium ramulus TaxID=39490 RepID=UPI00300E7CD5